MSALSPDEIQRYSRQLLLPEFGLEGQERLKDARVLLVGVGGLGSPLALYLAAAGVGTLGLVDADVVDATNLHRQLLHGTKDVGRPKLASAADRIRDVNPHVALELHETLLTSANGLDIVSRYDVVADGSDNFPTRYLVNDACALLGKPNVHGSIFRFDGQVSVFDAARGPCYRCLYPDPPPPGVVPSCAEGGVLGVLPGVIGVLQGIETLKLLLGIGEPLIGRLLLFDALGMEFRELQLRKDPDCPLCGERRTITTLIDYEQFCGLPPANAPAAAGEIGARELQRLVESGAELMLLDVREPFEDAIARIPGAKLVPLGGLPSRIAELDRSKEIVIYCHHGVRSRRALEFLRTQGFERLRNLSGGIDAWSVEVDPRVPRY